MKKRKLLTLSEAARDYFSGTPLKEAAKQQEMNYNTLGSIKSRALKGMAGSDMLRTILLKAGYTEVTEFSFQAPKERRESDTK